MTILERYVADAEGNVALGAALLARDLMCDDPETLKRGYTEDNAVLAAADLFGLSVDEVSGALHDRVLANEGDLGEDIDFDLAGVA